MSRFFLSILLFYCTLVSAQSIADKYANQIKAQDLSEYLHILASDNFQGRETGEMGQKMAADYLKNFFIQQGIQPIKGLDKGYYQTFPIQIKYPETKDSYINIGTDSIFHFFDDFYHFRGFEDGVFAADQLLFLGYGIQDEQYNDYVNKAVKDKIVVMLSGVPPVLKGTKKEVYWTKNWRIKLKTAYRQGVKAVIVLDQKFKSNTKRLDHYVKSPYVRLTSDTTKSNLSPAFFISSQAQEELLLNTGYTLKKLQKKARKKPFSCTLNKSVEVVINRKGKKATGENVLAYIEGTDKKDEIIVLTAHYDHLGIKDGKIYNGADDDGSGTAALMEIAQSFANAKAGGNGPRRSILIMPVAGEEKGLLGSKYYTQNPVFSLENTVANLNIDMIGRIDSLHQNGDYIYLIGSDKLSSELHQISEQQNKKHTQLDLDYRYNAEDDPNRFYYRSDHYNFAKNNIPVIFYFNGVHEDYHKETDTVEKIDFTKMEKITRLVFHTAWELANREERIVVDSNKK